MLFTQPNIFNIKDQLTDNYNNCLAEQHNKTVNLDVHSLETFHLLFHSKNQ